MLPLLHAEYLNLLVFLLISCIIVLCLHVHSVQQKSIGLIFLPSCSGSDVCYIYHHNSSRYLRIRGVSLSSIHYNQSQRLCINRRQQNICLIRY